MTDFHPLDVLAYALITLVMVGLVGRYVYSKLMAAITALQQAVMGLQQTDTTIADEQVAQTVLLTKLTQEAANQTVFAQKTYYLQVQALRPNIEAERRARIVDTLADSGAYDTYEARSGLLLELPPQLCTILQRSQVAKIDLQQMVQQAARWQHDGTALLTLLDNATDYLNGSDAGMELRRIRAELMP